MTQRNRLLHSRELGSRERNFDPVLIKKKKKKNPPKLSKIIAKDVILHKEIVIRQIIN